MDAVGAVGARRKYREAPTPNEAGGGTCMLRRAIIPLTCMFNCRVYLKLAMSVTTDLVRDSFILKLFPDFLKP